MDKESATAEERWIPVEPLARRRPNGLARPLRSHSANLEVLGRHHRGAVFNITGENKHDTSQV